ncbi:MAG: cytochrome c [Reyranellaceae bacterium]
MKKLGLIVVVIAVAAVAVWYFALRGPSMDKQVSATEAATVIKARKDNRQQVRTAMGAIKKVIDDKGNAADVVPHATKIVELEKQFVTLFPAGSDKGDTKALPTIWSDMAGFQAASKATETAAMNLADAGKSGDLTKVAAAFGAAGKSCGDCHDKYRAK